MTPFEFHAESARDLEISTSKCRFEEFNRALIGNNDVCAHHGQTMTV
jgi:hypothetical protein